MKCFIFGYNTNYDLGASIVYAKDLNRAIEIAKNNDYVWDTDNVHEVEMPKTEKIILVNEYDFQNITNE